MKYFTFLLLLSICHQLAPCYELTKFLSFFFADNVIIQDNQSLRMIGKGEVDDGLYVFHPTRTRIIHKTLEPVSFASTLHCNSVLSNEVSPYVWHCRLGYLSQIS